MVLWDERDKAVKAGKERLNNNNIENYTKDKTASYGYKGKDKYWYSYKRNVTVCMKNGFITQQLLLKLPMLKL